MRAQCIHPVMDGACLNDIERVINFQVETDYLVLQLDNNAGVMYFVRDEGI